MPISPISPIGPIVPREGPERSAGADEVSLGAITGIGQASEEKLIAAGIKDVEALSKAKPQEVASALGLKNLTNAKAIIDEATRLERKK